MKTFREAECSSTGFLFLSALEMFNPSIRCTNLYFSFIEASGSTSTTPKSETNAILHIYKFASSLCTVETATASRVYISCACNPKNPQISIRIPQSAAAWVQRDFQDTRPKT